MTAFGGKTLIIMKVLVKRENVWCRDGGHERHSPPFRAQPCLQIAYATRLFTDLVIAVPVGL
jgi:hypothetical protein